MTKEPFALLMIALTLIAYFLIPLWEIYKLDGTKPFEFGMDKNWRIKRKIDYVSCYIRMVSGLIILSVIWWKYL